MISNEFNTCKCASSEKKMIGICYSNLSDNENPIYAKSGDSGFDLRAWITEDENDKREITIKPLERKLIKTGLYFELHKGTEMQVRPRSGLALKKGITVLNTPGTIDEKYRGEICVILVNLSNEEFVVKNGDKIAQGVICPVYNSNDVSLLKVSEIDKSTERGENGFGHTDI